MPSTSGVASWRRRWYTRPHARRWMAGTRPHRGGSPHNRLTPPSSRPTRVTFPVAKTSRKVSGPTSRSDTDPTESRRHFVRKSKRSSRIGSRSSTASRSTCRRSPSPDLQRADLSFDESSRSRTSLTVAGSFGEYRSRHIPMVFSGLGEARAHPPRRGTSTASPGSGRTPIKSIEALNASVRSVINTLSRSTSGGTAAQAESICHI